MVRGTDQGCGSYSGTSRVRGVQTHPVPAPALTRASHDADLPEQITNPIGKVVLGWLEGDGLNLQLGTLHPPVLGARPIDLH